MRDKRPARLLALLFIAFLVLPAHGRMVSGCPKAARSNDGRFLVLSDYVSEPRKGEPGVSDVTRITMQIFADLDLGSLYFKSPMTFWSGGALWKVVIERNKGMSMPVCPVPVIPDDAAYLVLLSDADDSAPSNMVMQIFRQPGRTQPSNEWPPNGIFVRELTLKEIWPGYRFSDGFINSGTPSWFVGGTFEWGKDNHSLVYKTHWGETIQIDLNTGSVSKDSK